MASTCDPRAWTHDPEPSALWPPDPTLPPKCHACILTHGRGGGGGDRVQAEVRKGMLKQGVVMVKMGIVCMLNALDKV